MGMKLQKYGKSLITPSNEVNIYDWKGNNAPRQIRYTPSTGMYQLDGETITSKQLNDLGWNKVPRAATRGTGTGTGTGKPTINSQWNAVIKLNETSKNLISEQVAANPVFKTFIMGKTGVDASQVGQMVAGRIEGIAQQLKIEDYNNLYTSTEQGDILALAQQPKRGPNAYVQDALALYLEGGGLQEDTSASVGADSLSVSSSPLTLKILRNNRENAKKRNEQQNRSSGQYNALNPVSEFSQQNDYGNNMELFNAVSAGKTTPEAVLTDMINKGAEMTRPQAQSLSSLLVAMRDSPEFMQVYTRYAGSDKQKGQIAKLIDTKLNEGDFMSYGDMLLINKRLKDLPQYKDPTPRTKAEQRKDLQEQYEGLKAAALTLEDKQQVNRDYGNALRKLNKKLTSADLTYKQQQLRDEELYETDLEKQQKQIATPADIKRFTQ